MDRRTVTTGVLIFVTAILVLAVLTGCAPKDHWERITIGQSITIEESK